MHSHEHQETHLHSSALVKDIVIGMSDGLTVPFALAAGLSGAVHDAHIIVIAGLAEVAAGAIAMGLGGYLAGKTEQDHYSSELKREEWEVDNLPEKEKEEVRVIFEEMGISPATQRLVVEELANDKDKWVEFMMRYELGLEKPNPKRARNSALNIGLSYVAGGLVPLSPYFFVTDPVDGLLSSCIITVICLFIFGYFKAQVTGQPKLMGAIRVTIIGSLAAAAAFMIARLFTH
jgi:VIT1/CCC1 family predicted Fe2+/Mn2+ transporter